MKSKRMKNFCQVCRKQCKDENGYHCHLNSGHHQKNLRQLATNPQQHIEKYSNQLQNRIIQILKSKYPGQKKDIEDIYEEYAEDKYYVKFNFTRWKDLPDFVQHLKTIKNLKVEGKLPYCNVTYVVSKSDDFLKQKKQQQMMARRQKQKQLSQKRLVDRIARMRQVQSQRMKQNKQQFGETLDNQPDFDIDNEQLRFDFEQKPFNLSKLFVQSNQISNSLDINKQIVGKQKQKQTNREKLLAQLNKKLQSDNLDNQTHKNKQQDKSASQFEWITPGIIVKILPHQIPQVFHNKKVQILKISEPYVAQVKIGNAFLTIDQSFLQTVVPKIGHIVKILKGINRNKDGILQQINIQAGIAVIKLNENRIQAAFNQFSKTV